jgi:hypothetical protein
MNKGGKFTYNKIIRIITFVVSGTAIVELALSRFFIKMTRLSAVEMTGIALFAFIIFGLVTLFAVTRMGNTFRGKSFAVLMNIITALSATWYLNLLLGDGIFFRNIYYSMNRQTGIYELISLPDRISASVPLAGIIAAAAIYCLSGLVIFLTMVIPERNTRGRGKNREN